MPPVLRDLLVVTRQSSLVETSSVHELAHALPGSVCICSVTGRSRERITNWAGRPPVPNGTLRGLIVRDVPNRLPLARWSASTPAVLREWFVRAWGKREGLSIRCTRACTVGA